MVFLELGVDYNTFVSGCLAQSYFFLTWVKPTIVAKDGWKEELSDFRNNNEYDIRRNGDRGADLPIGGWGQLLFSIILNEYDMRSNML